MSSNTIRHTSGRNLCTPTCPVDHTIRRSKVKKPKNGWPDIRGLHSLQLSRAAWLNRAAIDVAIREVYNGLPLALQDKIDLNAPEVENLFSSGPKGEDALSRVVMGGYGRILNTFKAKEYSIWPVNVEGNHWVTVVMHKAKFPNTFCATQYTHVTQMAIIDPFRSKPNHDLVTRVLRRFLEAPTSGCTFAQNYERRVWVPLQRDGTSCGPRCYWAAKQIMEHLLSLYETGQDYHEALWSDHSGWFDEDFVRGEMIGRNAQAAVRGMDYNARVAVECVNRVRPLGAIADDKVPWLSAADTMRPPPKTYDQVPERKDVRRSTGEVPLHKHRIRASMDTNAREFIVIPDDEDEPLTKGPMFAMGPRNVNPFRPTPPPRNFKGVGTRSTIVLAPRPANHT